MEMAGVAPLRAPARPRESDEENLKEECSSTESTHHEVGAQGEIRSTSADPGSGYRR